MIERPPLIEITSNSSKREVVFSSNDEYILNRAYQSIEVWRVKDGGQVASMEAERECCCLAVSNDGKWVAAGSLSGVYVWDANTYEQTFTLQDGNHTHGLDFSPDSTRLVTGTDTMINVWDVATHERVLGPLEHESFINTVKYSPYNDQIAAATSTSIRIFDNHDGRLSVDIPITENSSFRWSKNQLFINPKGIIKLVDDSSGATISEWPVSQHSGRLTIALPHHKEFLAYFTGSAVTFWDTTMRHQFDHIQHTRDITAISFSRDDRFLAIADDSGKIIIREIPRIIIPFIDLPEAVLNHWLQDHLTEVEGFLTKNIAAASSTNQPSHQTYAYRALIRARSGFWNTAVEDAEKSIKAHPSVIGYIAKSVALIGEGNKGKVGCVFDLAYRHIQFHGSADPLLLIKAVVLFIVGNHDEAMSHVNELIDAFHSNSICYVVLAYMHLLLGDSHSDKKDYESAIQSYGLAQRQMRSYPGPFLNIITSISGWKFYGLRITIRQHLCEALYAADQTKEAGECLTEIVYLFDEEAYVHGYVFKWVSDFIQRYDAAPEVDWMPDFKLRCAEKAVHFGDVAVDDARHDDAILHYSAALSLDTNVPYDVLVKRSKAQAAMGSWLDALNDANEAIALDPSSPWGYERKYIALGVAGHHKDKSDAFETMLSKMIHSDDPEIRKRGEQYLKTHETIRGVIRDTILDLPLVLINTTSGQLCNRSEQAVAFELLPSFVEFVSTMTTHLDMSRIQREVAEYYRYATFSHKNEVNEPLFEEVASTAVYELEELPTHEKLQKFCHIVRDTGIHWAWSNTCCIDASDHPVLQETFASMFRWYQESSLTIIYLLDVGSPSQHGDLVTSIWNARAWMLQEYHASKVVRFYSNDWTLYRNLDIPNHKESPEIISEIEEATSIPTETLAVLQSDLKNIREKLYLASKRETTLVEDGAYSLFGIFGISLPVVYGEGDKALGHLLSQLLTKSGDATILAWTGTSGSFNSCLPSNTSVYHELSPSHVKESIDQDVVDEVAADLRDSSLKISFMTKLIDRLKELPELWFTGQELNLPCLTFRVEQVSAADSTSDRVFHAQNLVLGNVEIKTCEDISGFESLYLVHPWIDFLLDRPIRSVRDARKEESEYEGSVEEVLAFPVRPNVTLATVVQGRTSRFVARLKQFRRARSRSRSESPPPVPVPTEPPVISQGNKQMKVVQFAARLQQPFDAFLMVPDGRDGTKYSRVAADCRIVVQIREMTVTVLNQLVEGVQVLAVL